MEASINDSSNSSSTEPVLPRSEELRGAIEAAIQAHRQVASSSAALCLDPAPNSRLEEDFALALSNRRDACARLGSFVVRWIAAGGTLETIPPRAEVQEEAAEVQATAAEPVAMPAFTSRRREVVVPPMPAPGRPSTLPPVPAPRQSLVGLKQHFTGGFSEQDAGVDLDSDILETVIATLQRAIRIGTPIDNANSYTGLVSALSEVTLGTNNWSRLDQETQKALVGLCASLARHLQDEAGPALNLPLTAMSLGPIFSRLTQFSKAYQPGFVLGLSRSHGPELETWMGEAVRWLGQLDQELSRRPESAGSGEPANPERRINDLVTALEVDDLDRQTVCEAVRACLDAGLKQNDPRLVRILDPHLELLTKDPGLKALRKHIRDARDADEAENKADNGELPSDWPYFDYTRGKRVVVLGGDPRNTTMVRLQRTFGFEEVLWESGWQKRRIQALGSQIEAGTVAMVIFLARFMSHATWDAIQPICKAARVPFVRVESGYGTSQIRAAMEHTLGGFSKKSTG